MARYALESSACSYQNNSILRASLIAVWAATVAASLIECNGQSLQLLQAGGMQSLAAMRVVIALGVLLDMALLLALWLRPGRATYAASAAAVVGLTLVATALLPALWLHPLGPLSKNLPILAVLWVLWRQA